MSLEEYLHRFATLNVGRVGEHERPHKPALLLAIISMVEAGQLNDGRVTYDHELFSRFRTFFEVVRGEGDRTNMIDPFWRLRTDGLLEHKARDGFEEAVKTYRTAPTVTILHEVSTHSELPDDLLALIADPSAREWLRNALVQRYFPDKADALAEAIRREQGIAAFERLLESEPDAGASPASEADESNRDQAFRRVVLRAYDYRCAACGLRVLVDDLVLVEAAHLVPFAVSRDDDPRNGMALCKNHHWAMDRELIAPTTALTWHVSPCLDDRIEGQQDLIGLANR